MIDKKKSLQKGALVFTIVLLGLLCWYQRIDNFSDDFLRVAKIAVFVLSIYLGWFSYKIKSFFWLYAWSIIGILFNPFVLINLEDDDMLFYIEIGLIIVIFIFGYIHKNTVIDQDQSG